MFYGSTLWLGQDQLENRRLLYGVCEKEAGIDEVDWGGVLGLSTSANKGSLISRSEAWRFTVSNTGISDRMMLAFLAANN